MNCLRTRFRWSAVVAVAFGLLVLAAGVLRAQRFDYIWYFGYGAGLDFRSGSPTPLNDGRTVAFEGTAVATDPVTHSLVFYTDGKKVWDSTHQMVLQGMSGGFSSTQSVVVVPAPGYHRRYYIFTTALVEGGPLSSAGLQYTIVDFHQPGLVVVLNRQLVTPTCEKVAAIGTCDGDAYWIVTHKWGNNEFYAYHLTMQGLDTSAVISAVGTPTLSGAPLGYSGVGYLSMSPDGRRLAMGMFEPGNYAGVFSFNPTSGRVSSEIRLLSDVGIYGINFSPDGSKLYAGSIGSTRLLQFDLSSNDSATIVASRTVLDSTLSYGGIEPGVDGKLYLTSSGAASIAVIDSPNVAGVACNFRANAVPVGTGVAQWGLPNVVNYAGNRVANGTSLNLGSDTSLCPGHTLRLHARGADHYFWSPAAGLSCNDCSDPEVLLDTTTTYIVVGSYDSGCVVSQVDTITVYVGGDGLPVTARGAQVICPGTEALLVADVDPDAYIQWTSATDTVECDTCHVASVYPTRTTNYYLSAYIRGGCSGRDSVTVIVDPNGLKVNAAGRSTICRGGAASISVAAPPKSQVLWSPYETLDCDTCAVTQAHPTRTTMYYVDVFDSTGCRGRDSVLVIVDTVGIPVDATGATTICPGSIAQLNISAFLSGFHIRWSPGTDLDCDTCTSVNVRPQTTTTYRVEVWDDRGCRGEDSVTVTIDTSLLVSAAGAGVICEGNTAFLSVDAPPGASVTWSPSQGLDCDTCAATEAHPSTTTTYHVEVVDSSGCHGHDSVEVKVRQLLAPMATADGAICPGASLPIAVQVPATARVRWFPSAGLDCDTCASTSAAPSATTTYYVQVISDGACYSLDSVVVRIDSNGLPVQLLGDASACPGAQTLLQVDAPSGTHIRWRSSGDQPVCDTCARNLVQPGSTTTYIVEGWTDAGCRGSDTLTLVVSNNGLAVNAGATDSICTGGVAALAADVPPGTRLRWTPSAGLACDTCAVTEARPSATTLYHLLVQDSSGCRGEDSVLVAVVSPRPLPLTGGGDLCRGDSTIISADVPPGAQVRWTPSAGLACDTCPTTVARPTTTTWYTAQLLNGGECTAPDSVQVIVRDPVVVVVEVGGGGETVVQPGTPATLPITLRGLPPGVSISELAIALRYDRSMLRLLSVEGEGELGGWVTADQKDDWKAGTYSGRFTSTFGNRLENDGTVLELEFESYYGGDTLLSLVEVESLELAGLSCLQLSPSAGRIRLDSLCWALMRGVEYSPFGSDKVLGVRPDPASEEVQVRVNVGEEKEIEVLAVDIAGKEHQLGGGRVIAGEHELLVSVKRLSSGWYRLIVRNGEKPFGSRLLLVIH